jgi:hypothetical protein
LGLEEPLLLLLMHAALLLAEGPDAGAEAGTEAGTEAGAGAAMRLLEESAELERFPSTLSMALFGQDLLRARLLAAARAVGAQALLPLLA